MIEYYSLERIQKIKNVQYYMIYGERSNGKSYAVDKEMLDNFFTKGEEFVICKRYDEDMKTKVCSTMLTPLDDYISDTYDYKMKYYQGRWWAYPNDSDGKMVDCVTMGYSLAINQSDRIKGSQFPKVTTILFEEFMSQSATYLPDEVNLFLNVVSTITRYRTNVKIYLLGNAISKHSPYSEALGIRLHRLNKGEIVTQEYKDKKGRRTKFAIERTENVDVFDNDENINKIVYNVFGNSGVGNMITTGDFETHNYNLTICGVTFDESINELTYGKYKIVNRKDRTNILIKYEDYFYSVYRVINGDEIVFAFREIEHHTINPKHYNYIINNKTYYPNMINIVNLNTYTDKIIDPLLDEILQAYKQDKFIFINNDNGEDVNSAFNIVMQR